MVKKFNIASGKPTADGSMLSDTGTFYVYLKYESQTMVGEGYNQPGTPWVSYYNGGEALHGVPAYMWGEHPIYVQQGIPGSHGCINMQVADASGCTTLSPSALVWSLMAPHRLPVRRCARLVRMPPDGRAATPADSICLIDNGKSPTCGPGIFL